MLYRSIRCKFSEAFAVVESKVKEGRFLWLVIPDHHCVLIDRDSVLELRDACNEFLTQDTYV